MQKVLPNLRKVLLKTLGRLYGRWFFLFALLLLMAGAAPTKDAIVLPEILAIELPKPQMTEIAPTEAPLRQLLESATAGVFKVTHDRLKPLPIGGTLITWIAWDGTPAQSRARAMKSAHVYVLPYGQTPIGVSGNDHATAGNQSAKVVRDAAGKIHAAWLDAARPGQGYRVLYRRGVQDASTGTVSWETEAIPVSDGRAEAWGSYVALEASDNAIHFVWSTTDTARYRRLLLSGADWKFEPIRDTRAGGEWHDNGPDISVRGDNEIHVLTPTGNYAVSKNGGLTWAVDKVPVPPGSHIKSPALAVDSFGNAHVAFTGQVRNAQEWSYSKPNHGYWELRYVRREPGGAWVDAQNVLAPFPQWSDSKRDWDILSDWPHITVDKNNNIHLAWHGTVNTHIFGNDEAFYIRRPATAEGKWGNWNEPRPLHPLNVAKGEHQSFAPSIALNATGDVAVALVFFDTTDGEHLLDYDARILRSGNVEGAPIVLSRLARITAAGGRQKEALSSWFPVVGPRLFRHPNGRVWLDVLTTVAVPEHHQSPHLVVYHRTEVTNYLGKTRS
jgi:hypothetical protein